MSATATRVASTVTLDDEFADFEVREELERQLEKRLTEVDLDTSPALKNFEPNADNDQLGIIRAKEPLIRLVAPAGSGKTQTVVNRVLKLAAAGTKPERILCLTFDNSAATALREKLAEQTTNFGGAAQDFTITTLNAFGFRILREMFPSERKDVIDAGRSYRLMREVKAALLAAPGGASRHGALPETLRLRFYMEFFSLLKNETFDPRSLPAQQLADFMLSSPTAEAWFTPGMNTETKRLVIQAVHWMFKAYEQRLQRENRLDFDDQKLRTLVCLQDAPEILQRLQRRYEEVIVDEFQDINKLDFELIRRIAGQARLIVTGDDDQAIYGFRGCSPTYIIDLAKHLNRDVTTYELRRNYRCPKNIVDHSTRLIRNNTWRLEKNPIAHRPENATIKVVESTTATAEAKALATTIHRVRSKNASLQLKDFAVLYRTNAQSLPIQLQFILRDIPYTVRQQDNILHNEELEKLLGVLRVKLAIQKHQPIHPHDGVLTLKSYFRNLDQRLEHRLEALFGSTPFLDAIASSRLHNLLPKARSSNFSAAMAEVIKQPSLFKTLDVLAKDFKGLRGMVGSLEEVVEGDVPLGEVYELAASFRGSIEGFVETVGDALRRARAGHAGEHTNGVNLLTYFKAKGLQWHTVMLTSCNQGIIPHKRAKIDDERRLFYVALTRASSNLIVSYLKTSCKTKVPPSVFLTEAGFRG